MNEEEPINEYKESRKLKFNLTGKPGPGNKSLEQLTADINKLSIEIDEWCKNADK
jgi:hypothetical protein